MEQEFAVADLLQNYCRSKQVSPKSNSSKSAGMSHLTATHIGDISSLPDLQIVEYGGSFEYAATPTYESHKEKTVTIVKVKKNKAPANFLGKPIKNPVGDQHSCTTIPITPRGILQIHPGMRMSVANGDN